MRPRRRRAYGVFDLRRRHPKLLAAMSTEPRLWCPLYARPQP